MLKSLAFDTNPMSIAQINYSCFGNGMLLAGFLLVAFIILSLSNQRFVPLGFQGSAYKAFVLKGKLFPFLPFLPYVRLLLLSCNIS